MKQVVIAALFIASGPIVAIADDAPQVDCNNASSQVEMTYCAEQDFNKADKQLNAVYKQAVTTEADIDKTNADVDQNYVGAVDSLKKAQRIWITYRDAHCDTVGYEAVGGTMQGMLILGCKAEMTNTRIKELKELIRGLDN